MSSAGKRRKVCVIGAGAVGVAVASWLQRDGHAVCVLDPSPVGEGASFGNAGCLNASSIVPMSLPGTLHKVPGWLLDPLGPLAIRWFYLPVLAPWLVRFVRAGRLDRVEAQARALKLLLDDAVGSYRPLVENAGVAHLVRRDGYLAVYRTKALFGGDALGFRLRRDNGIPFTVLEKDELWQFEPSLSHEYEVGVHLEENGHTVNPNLLVRGLADAFLRNGGRILRTAAAGFDLDDGRLRGVRTRERLIEADAAVVAAGAHSRPFAQELGDRVMLETERGYHALIENSPVMPRLPVMDAVAKFVATPMDMGLRLAGTVEFAGLRAPPNWRRALQLETLGARLLPGLNGPRSPRRLSIWMGCRPSLPDSLPVIGPARRSRDVVYAFGHGHVGLAAAARTGRLVADLISGRPPSIDIAPFSAGRFA